VLQTALIVDHKLIEKWERLIIFNRKFLLIKRKMWDMQEREIMSKRVLDFNLRQMQDGMLRLDMPKPLILVKWMLIKEDKMSLALKYLNKLITLNLHLSLKNKSTWTIWEFIQIWNKLQLKKQHQKWATIKNNRHKVS
jgi:hypothetical protein